MTKMVSNTASMVRIWQNDCFRSMLQSKKKCIISDQNVLFQMYIKSFQMYYILSDVTVSFRIKMSATNLRDLSTTMEARLPTRPSTPTTGRATPSRENLVTSMTRSESITVLATGYHNSSMATVALFRSLLK